MTLCARLVALFRCPRLAPTYVYGTIPGRLWDVRAARWVDDAESYCPRRSSAPIGVDYTLVGPVMMTTPDILPT